MACAFCNTVNILLLIVATVTMMLVADADDCATRPTMSKDLERWSSECVEGNKYLRGLNMTMVCSMIVIDLDNIIHD